MVSTKSALTFSKLRVGIFVLLGLAVLGFLVLNSSGDFNPFEKKMRLKARFAAADGLREGSAVQLAGVRIGKVEDVTLLPPDSPALHLIQRVRDEAHRFAITGHRARRAKARTQSVLETVPGLGPRKRRELLRQFGGLQGVTRAGIDDLAKVHGISRKLAQSIYDTLHANG